MNKRWIWAAALSTVVGLSPGTVSASGSYHERWHDVNSGQVDWCPFDADLYTWSVDVSGNLTIRARGDGIAYFTETAKGTVLWTNTETGKTFSRKFAGNSHDLAIVDNGDGTLTITAQGSGSDRYYDSSGRLVLTNNGMMRWSVLIDHGGTPGDPTDDEFIADLGIVKPSTGTNDTEGRDFCDDLVAFTT